MIDNTLDSNSASRILSVGGYGPVDQHLEKSSFIRNAELITLDIEEKHNPDILIDITECSKVITPKTFDAVVAIEVLEHVLDPITAVKECHDILKENGVLILSTPWIIPIHDRPFDYYRFTPQALEEICKDFSSITIYARGDYFDSIVLLMLRGLFIKGRAPRIFLLIGTLISITSRKPKFYSDVSSIDSTMGYFLIARK